MEKTSSKAIEKKTSSNINSITAEENKCNSHSWHRCGLYNYKKNVSKILECILYGVWKKILKANFEYALKQQFYTYICWFSGNIRFQNVKRTWALSILHHISVADTKINNKCHKLKVIYIINTFQTAFCLH
ncbi:hypothetical protein KUTeg_016901 [Tegillarca granosa]|uniref:Uncharacterized protein n=1 Tax=Tegillarca granosa TaxID=220873 RepID=A0ABQ9ER37_TEGGR|nr:hypothetical protein KUTeg_016901 [Tegillarca granosa]